MNNGNLVEGQYYHNHDELACYYCVVSASDASLPSDFTGVDPDIATEKKRAYYTALAREKYRLTRLSSYVNGSGEQS